MRELRKDDKYIRVSSSGLVGGTRGNAVPHFFHTKPNACKIALFATVFTSIPAFPHFAFPHLIFRTTPLPRQQKFRAMIGAHLASPIRGELGYAHWPLLGSQIHLTTETLIG